MIKQIMEYARPAMQLSIAVFFLVSSGWVVRLYWIDEPIQALGRRLLAKDGALLIKILSNDRTISSIRRLTAPSGKAPAKPGALHHLIDQLVAKDGALLKGLSTQLLRQPTVQKLLLQRAPASKSPPPLVTLGRYAVDRLLAKDAALANKLTIEILGNILPKPKKRSKAKAVPDSWAMIERLGRHAIARLFAQRGGLAIHVTNELIANQMKKAGKPQPSKWDLQALLKGLGEHAIDRLTTSRAQPLRAILQSLLGPEPMRALRSLRQVVQQLSSQVNKLHIGQLAREAAYQLGRGGLEAFLREQQAARQREARQARKLQLRRAKARQALRAVAPCFVPRGAAWLRYKKGAITANLHVLHQHPKCKPLACRAQRHKARALLWKESQDLLDDPADLVIQLTPRCDGLTKPTPPRRAASKPQKTPPQGRPNLRKSQAPGTRQPTPKRAIPTKR